MVGPSDRQLSKMRAQAESLMPDTAVIQDVSFVSDGAGGQEETWSAVTGGTVSCRLDPLSERSQMNQIVASQERLKVYRRATVPYDAPAAANRRLVVNNETYEIVALDDDHSWRVSRRLIIARLD